MVDKSQQEEENTNLETDIDDTLELRKPFIRKYDISSMTEGKIIYDILPEKESSIILEDKNIKDRNKVKRVLFRYIFTNKSNNTKFFKAEIRHSKFNFNEIQQNNCCIVNKYIFFKVNGEDMTNFYNIMRIRGELPFMKRENINLQIDITNGIKFSNY